MSRTGVLLGLRYRMVETNSRPPTGGDRRNLNMNRIGKAQLVEEAGFEPATYSAGIRTYAT